MNQIIRASLLAGIIAFSSGQAAVVNVNLNVTTADGFAIQDQSSAGLIAGNLIKIGVFVNTTSGAALSGSEITSLFTSQSDFAAGRDSLLASFVEIGEARIGFGLANGSGVDGAVLNGLTGATTDHPFGTTPFEYANGLDAGTFRRNWLDNTMQIQNSNVGTSPFNSIANTKLNGLQVSLIAFNASTLSGATELMVARNSVSTEALPSAEGDSVTFGLDASSELLVGSSGTAAFLTIPEPGTTSLVCLASALLLGHRRLRLQRKLPNQIY